MALAAQQKKVSFRAKEASKCPICGTSHNREELLSGGGRLIAGNMTNELRRLYEESKKWGKIYPLAYVLTVCPKCLFSSFTKDFKAVKPEEKAALQKTVPQRQKILQVLFNGKVDYNKDRDLLAGVASYILAVDCYHLRMPDVAPTPKKAVCSIRAAWLLDDLSKLVDYRPYDKVRDFYYMEAANDYRITLDLMQSNAEPIDQAVALLGPSLDHNWAFDGIIYLNSFLTRKYIDQMATTVKQKLDLITLSKRYLAKLYGSGKASKSRPSVIMDKAKDLYDEMGVLLKSLEEQMEEN